MTLRTAAHQASLSYTISRSLFRFMSTELVILSSHLILCHPFSSCLQPFLASEYFPMGQLIALEGRSIGGSASVSVLSINVQSIFPLGLNLLAVQGTLKGHVNHHNSKTLVLWSSAFCVVQLSLLYMTTRKTISSFRFISVVQSCPTLCNPMDCSRPGCPVHHPT